MLAIVQGHLKGPENIFFYVRKLLPQKSNHHCLAREFFTLICNKNIDLNMYKMINTLFCKVASTLSLPLVYHLQTECHRVLESKVTRVAYKVWHVGH